MQELENAIVVVKRYNKMSLDEFLTLHRAARGGTPIQWVSEFRDTGLRNTDFLGFVQEKRVVGRGSGMLSR